MQVKQPKPNPRLNRSFLLFLQILTHSLTHSVCFKLLKDTPSVKLNGLLVSLKTKTWQRRLQLAPSSTDHKSGAAGRAEPQHCSNVSETRVMLVVRGLLLLLKLLALAPSSCPWTSSSTSPSLCSSSSQAAGSCVHIHPDHTNLASCLPGHHPLHHSDTSGDTCLQY